MDKDRFRELLQSFEQLSVKPEAGGETELDFPAGGTETPDLGRREAEFVFAEPAVPSIDDLLSTARECQTTFEDLEEADPLPTSNNAFQPCAALEPSSAPADVHALFQCQRRAATRFRFIAGQMLNLWYQADNAVRDRVGSKSSKAGLEKMKDSLLAICSASLIEAGQMEVASASNGTPAPCEPTYQAQSPRPSSGYQNMDTMGQEIALGARILNYASSWPAVTADTWVLRAVTEGVRFEFSSAPELGNTLDAEYTAEDCAAIEKVVRWDLGDKVIEEIPYRPDLFISQMYTLPIAGKLKALVEFRQLNTFLEARNIVVEEAPSLCSLLHKGDWITRVKIKCAYPSVPVHPDHRRFTVFRYDGRYYQYRALPFGISVASRVFTRLLQAALRPLREDGYRITSHIDEICLVNDSCAKLAAQTQRVFQHLSGLGFLVNLSASDLEPQQTQRFLGFTYNIVDGTVLFPRDQIKKVRRAAHVARSSTITAKQLAALLGKIRSIMPAVGPQPSRIRQLEMCLELSIISPESWSSQIALSPPALEEIDWLCENILTLKLLQIAA